MFNLLVGAIVVVVAGASKYRNRDGNEFCVAIETRSTHDKPQETITLDSY